MAEPISAGASVLASFLGKAGSAVAGSKLASSAATAAASGAASAGVASALAPSASGPKTIPIPRSEPLLAKANEQRRLARMYAEQGRVGSVFGKDKLG